MAASHLSKITTIAMALCLSQSIYGQPGQPSQEPQVYQLPKVNDPLEKLNQKTFLFNKFLDSLYIKPASVVYDKALPLPAKMSVGNFVNNLGEIPVVINGILQGKFDQALRDTSRFGINSTFGIFGLFDVATQIGLKAHKEDFGKTLYAWGWKQSDYFVIPILGPSTVRDAIGIAGNLFLSAPSRFKTKWRNRYYALALVNKRNDASEFEGIVGVAGVNYYNLVRSGYLQNRQYQLDGGDTPLYSHHDSDPLGEPPE